MRLVIKAILVVVTLPGVIYSQAPPPAQSNQTKSEVPSISAGGNFTSLEGRFSVGLPDQNHGFHGLALPTPFGLARGDAYDWKMKEAAYVIGYADASQPVDSPAVASQVFDRLREDFKKLASSNQGLVWKDKQLELDKHPGIEQRLDLFSGFMIQRTYLVGSRLYQTVVVVRTSQREHEGLATKVLDSFKILSESDVAARLASEATDAEPDLLPQQPVAARVGTDASDKDLHGRVKTVLEESQDLTGTWAVQTKKRDFFEAYNEEGNLTRSEQYDYKGNLDHVTVYGYIDGSRVSRSKVMKHEYNPPPPMGNAATGAKKSDSRFQTRYEFKYDDQKRLIERRWFRNNGELSFRDVYNYKGNQKEVLGYSDNGALNQRNVYLLDNNGNEIERATFDPRDGAPGAKYSYEYVIDPKGNWIKRTTSKVVMKDGKSTVEPQYVDTRTITYY